MQLLNPRKDIVFKLMFRDQERLLLRLINDILRPSPPIVSTQVLNPQIDPNEVSEKTIILDILAQHEDGRRTNIEMQTTPPTSLGQRALFYWARAYGESLPSGKGYETLHDCHVVFILDYNHTEDEDMLSTYRALNTKNHKPLHSNFAITLVELHKLNTVITSQVDAWALFFTAENEQDRRKAIMAYPELQEATRKLEALSADPQVRRIVRDREVAKGLYLNDIANAQIEGERREKHRGERRRILSLCKVLKILLSDEQKERLEQANLNELTQVAEYIEEHGKWPS